MTSTLSLKFMDSKCLFKLHRYLKLFTFIWNVTDSLKIEARIFNEEWNNRYYSNKYYFRDFEVKKISILSKKIIALPLNSLMLKFSNELIQKAISQTCTEHTHETNNIYSLQMYYKKYMYKIFAV